MTEDTPQAPAGPVLLISGSTRTGSTNTALLRGVELAVGPAAAIRYDALASLPHFNPDDDVDGALPQPVIELRAAIDSASAILFCTPEYAGALPGSFKNLLDWTVGGGEIYRKRAAWVNVSHSGAVDAHESLAKVLDRVGADVIAEMVEADGLVHDEATLRHARAALALLAG